MFTWTPAPGTEPKKPAPWKVGGATILSFVAVLYLIEAWDAAHHQELNVDGIIEGTIKGPRQWQAKPFGRRADVDRQAIVAVAAIAAGGAARR